MVTVETQIGIVAHTVRAREAKTLAKQVQAGFVSVDNGITGCDENHRIVHRHLAGLPTTWSVILEDDAQPVEDFRNQLHQALMLTTSPIVSLYLGKQRPPQFQDAIEAATKQADLEEAAWIVATKLFHGVGYAIRTTLLPSLINHQSNLPIDQHISAWAQTYGNTIAYTWPSLVDHADTPTLIPHHPDGKPRPPGRVAWRTGHPNWNTHAVPLQPN